MKAICKSKTIDKGNKFKLNMNKNYKQKESFT